MHSPHTYVRIDNRLLHGQVVQFWIPHLKIDNLVIADDLAAANPAMVSVYRMAVPKHIELSVVTVAMLGDKVKEASGMVRLVVLSDVFDLARSIMSGFDFTTATIGNVHAAKGRKTITDAVHLSPEEIDALVEFIKIGKKIEIQTFPGDTLILSWTREKGAEWFKS